MEVFPLFAAAVVCVTSSRWSPEADLIDLGCRKSCWPTCGRHEFDGLVILRSQNVVYGIVYGDQTQHAGICEDRRLCMEHLHSHYVSLESREVDGVDLDLGDAQGFLLFISYNWRIWNRSRSRRRSCLTKIARGVVQACVRRVLFNVLSVADELDDQHMSRRMRSISRQTKPRGPLTCSRGLSRLDSHCFAYNVFG